MKLLELLLMDDKNRSDVANSSKGRYGYHCVAPGCTNWFYKTDESVHYHRLPLGNKRRVAQWLQNMKRKDAPAGESARICCQHFTADSYKEQGCFGENGSFSYKRTNRLKSDAVPTIFDFSSYDSNCTDAPANSSAGVNTDRVERALKRQRRQETDAVSVKYIIYLRFAVVKFYSLLLSFICCFQRLCFTNTVYFAV